MKKIIILLFTLYSVSSTTLAQSLFTKIYDTGENDRSNGNILTSDNIFLNYGRITGNVTGVPYIATFDLEGKPLEAKLIINSNKELETINSSTIIELQNGSFIMVAQIDSIVLGGGGQRNNKINTLVCNFDKNLNILWCKILGRNFNLDNRILINDVVETANNELILVGNNGNAAQLVKMDLTGNLLAFKDISLANIINSASLFKVKFNPSTGNYISIGAISSERNKQDILYITFDENFNILIQKSISSLTNLISNNFKIGNFGNIILIGGNDISQTLNEALLISISPSNTINWAFSYKLNVEDYSYGIDLIFELTGLKYVGYTTNNLNFDRGDIFVLPLSFSGIASTGKCFGINGRDDLHSLITIQDKFALSGYFGEPGGNVGGPGGKNADLFFSILDSNFSVPCSTIVVPVSVPVVALVNDVLSTSTKTIYSSDISFTTSSFSFEENDNPISAKVLYTGTLNICKPEAKRLSSSIISSFYLWNTGANARNINVTEPGAYYLQVLGPNGCIINSDTVILTVNSMPTKPVITNNRPLEFCNGDSTVLIAPLGFIYLWSSGDTSQEITVKNTGKYSVTITNANGCKAKSDDVTVTNAILTKPLIISSSKANIFCKIDTLTASASEAYMWNTGDTTQSITVNTTGQYFVTTRINGTCMATSDTLKLINFSDIVPNITAPTSVCFGDTIALSSANLMPNYTAHWILPNGTEDTTKELNLLQNYTFGNGDFSLYLTFKNCQSKTSKVSILLPSEIKTNLLNTYNKCTDDAIMLDATSTSTNATYSWSTGSTSPSILAVDTGDYSLTISSHGCTRVLNTRVLSEDCDFRITIPTAFSPNEDGNNEVFNISANQELKTYNLKIFDRWGENVFTSDDINARWNGKTTNGTLVNGTYVWLLQYTPMKGSTITEKGLINITR